MGLHWDDSEDIAMELIERHPNKDPLSLRFTDLREMVTNLPDFEDDPGKSNESLLERIQMAWYEEWGAGEG
jgi:FeS assembly protein IscX